MIACSFGLGVTVVFSAALLVLLPCVVWAQEQASSSDEPVEVRRVSSRERGALLFAAGDAEGAAEAYREALRADPGDASSRNRLAECHWMSGEVETARAIAAGGDPGGLIFGSDIDRFDPPSPAAAPLPQSSPLDDGPEARFASNPRESFRGAGGVAAFAPVVGFGVWAEARPHWSLAVVGTIGGAFRPVGAEMVCLMALAAELSFTPAPFRLSPEIGGGFLGLLGPDAWFVTDGWIAAPLQGPDRRGTAYGRFGVRVDGRRWTFAAAALVTAGPSGPVVFPSLRFGGWFR